MAYSQDHVTEKHPDRRQRQPPPNYYEWDSRHDPALHSLPHPNRHLQVQRPDEHRHRHRHRHSHSSHRRSRHSEDLHVRGPEPAPPRLMTRSATITHRGGGKSRKRYDHDESEDDDGSLPRSRLPSRSTSKSSSRPSQSREVTKSKKRAPVIHSASDSEESSGSCSRSSSADSASSASTQDPKGKTRRRRREPHAKETTQATPAPVRGERRREHRRHRKHVESEDDSDSDPGVEETIHVDDTKTSRRHRHGHRSRSRSSSRNRQRHHRRHRDGHHHSRRASHRESPRESARDSHRESHRDHHRDRHGGSGSHPSSSSKRSNRRHYTSEPVAYKRPSISRSYTTSSSHVASSQSISSSSKRSSTIRNLISPQSHPSSPRKPQKTVECVVCFDDEIPSKDARKLKCGHRMCEPCLKKSFRLSIKDPQQMPPKCCTSDCIPLRYVDRLFDNKFKRTWNRKFAEFSTQNRIYCPARKCGEWIKPSQIHRHRSGRKVGKCGRCDTRVCCECNNKWHDSRKCPTDEATKQILQQAKEEGWQRCFNCRAMVELKEGCNHMTCRCGSEFCMICGLKWKGCECPWFNYDAVEQDRLDHMEPPMPVMERDRLGGDVVSSPRGPRIGTNPGPALHSRQMTYEEEMLRRRLQVQRDEDYARRLHYEDDDEEDDYGGLGDIIGIGNTAGHFLNDDYRRISPNVNVPAPPPPPPPPFERTSSVGDYVAGVNRARGVRGSSMERRLAERFSEQRQGTSPAHRAFGHPIPMPPLPPHAVGPPPPPPVPLAPVPIVRRHTMDEDVHIGPSGGRMMDRIPPRRAVTRGFMEEVEPHTPLRRRTREQLPPSDSALAGLTGPGSGMNRVAEWAVHVKVGEPPPPSHAIVTR